MYVVSAAFQNKRRSPNGTVAHNHHVHLGRILLVNEPHDLADIVRGDRHPWRNISLVTLFSNLIEESERAVVIFLRDGIVLMIVALGALQGQRQEGLSKGARTVGYIFHPVLFIDHASFLCNFVIAVKARRQQHFLGGLW